MRVKKSDFRMNGGFLPHLAYSVILPACFLGSVLLYNPFGIREHCSFGNFSFEFHLVLMTSIILVTTLISRTILYFFLQHHELRWWQYGAWCVLETFCASAFIALYTLLFDESAHMYFDVLPTSMKYVFLTLCYPYMFLIFVRIVKLKDAELDRRDHPEDRSLIRFNDEHGRLKLSITPSSILYVSSESNYVKIFYLDGSKVRHYMLRASMKSIEALESGCLVRCQRSYFVNPEHISVLRKDQEGFIYAEMNVPDINPVPVSKPYYDALASLL